MPRYEIVKFRMNRRDVCRRLIGATAALEIACQRPVSPYFGLAIPSHGQRLRYSLGAEPDSLDPAYQAGGYEGYVLPALFEGLVDYHPQTLQPMAALATHFETKASPARLIFYLRGHPQPRGQPLPNINLLRNEYEAGDFLEDYSRGRRAPPDSIPAKWSDGHTVTAHDFVYAWCRLVDPRTAAPYAYKLNQVCNAREIQAGKLSPDQLGVAATSDFTFEIDLCGPIGPLWQRLPVSALAAVPRWAVEAAAKRGRESAWTDPERIVTSGAFLLSRKVPYERTVVVRNPRYYDADLVGLEEIEFIPVPDGVTTANLYRAGMVDAMPGERLSPLLGPTLEGHRDYHVTPACFVIWHGFNIHKPPFDNLLLRYALNMATNKEAIARALGGGRAPGRSLIPAIAGYDGPRTLPVTVDGATYDVLAYDPKGAQALLSKAGYRDGTGKDGRPLSFEVLFPNIPHSRPIAEMVHQQWRTNLRVEPRLNMCEFNVWGHAVRDLEYSGTAEWGGWPDYLDPRGLFAWFEKGSTESGTGYSDVTFDGLLAESDTLDNDPAARMQKLAECELQLLKSMPVIPIYHNVWIYLQKPFVRGLAFNALDIHPFKYVWIDTEWRPA